MIHHHHHNTVHAVDAASFHELVRRNPGAITSVVGDNLRNHGHLINDIGGTT